MKLTREELAKKLHITPAYLGHIERNAPVAVSKRIATEAKKELHVDIMPLLDQHNVHVLRVNKTRLKKAA